MKQENYIVYGLYDKDNVLLFIGMTRYYKLRMAYHWRCDDWFKKEVDRRRTRRVPQPDQEAARAFRKKCLLARNPKYREFYKKKRKKMIIKNVLKTLPPGATNTCPVGTVFYEFYKNNKTARTYRFSKLVMNSSNPQDGQVMVEYVDVNGIPYVREVNEFLTKFTPFNHFELPEDLTK